jgi:VanZ family protein
VNFKKALKNQLLAIIWTVFILVICNVKLGTNTGNTLFFAGFDKMVHLGLFFVLTVLLLYGKIKLQQHYQISLLTIFKIIATNAIIGGLVELLQLKIFTYRGAEWWDFIADILGALMGIFSYVLLYKSISNEKSNQN